MRSKVPHAILKTILTLVCLLSCNATKGQDQCLSADDIRTMRASLEARAPRSLNKKLRERLLKLREKDSQRINEAVWENRNPDALVDRLKDSREKVITELCRILKEFGWPTASLAGADGAKAAFFLLRNSASPQLQFDLLPVVTAAVQQEEIARPEVASYIDQLRLNAGLKQMFGTQATILDGMLVLYPIEVEKQVDERRKAYQLPPLADSLHYLELKYQLPLIRSTGRLANLFSDQTKREIAVKTTDALATSEEVEDNDVLRIDTNLVSFNVSVYSTKLRTKVSTLEQKDFAVSEDGEAQTITYFGRTDVPFDLVLLLDLSGSTTSKRKLIRTSTQRFIEAARPADRLAIVTFTSAPKLVSALTDDRAKLIESARKIEGDGGSNVWDALKFTLDTVVGPRDLGRRRAIVFMTDGLDNAMYSLNAGSKITFADLVEAVRHSDTLIVPVHLDTERSFGYPGGKRFFENARKMLMLLADESGGLYYRARDIEDLNGIYEQVVDDLGKVYSLGYRPTRSRRDGSWRDLKIDVLNHPELMTRARPGYYAN
jgi:VWFA-related protein